MRKIPIQIKRLHPDAVIPKYATAGAAGFDLVAVEDVIIEPGETALVKTGLAVALPPGYELQIRPRSGISLKTKLRIANSPGTIDSDYRGEIGVIVENTSSPELTIQDNEVWYKSTYICYDIDGNECDICDEIYEEYAPFLEGSVVIPKGTRIAQAVIAEVPRAVFTEVDSLDDTERGVGGFGSTGVGSYDDAELDAIRPEVSE